MPLVISPSSLTFDGNTFFVTVVYCESNFVLSVSSIQFKRVKRVENIFNDKWYGVSFL